MDIVTRILFGDHKGINILNYGWDYLIVLDACRCDIFKHVYRIFFPKEAKFRCIPSLGSSTMEFIKRSLSSDNVKKSLKDVIFVNANPIIDQVLGYHLNKIFYKYVPVWKNYWDEALGTVMPEDVYKVALKTFIIYSNKRMIIWFLQPHYPYISKKFNNINALGRNFMNKVLQHGALSNNLLILLRIAKNLLWKGYLCAGIPDKVCNYMKKSPKEIVKAYIINVLIVLYYVKELTEVLSGKIVITSDHGEAFGEPINNLLPISVYGHPSRIRISSLMQVPYLKIENVHSRREGLRRAIKKLSFLSLAKLKPTKYGG